MISENRSPPAPYQPPSTGAGSSGSSFPQHRPWSVTAQPLQRRRGSRRSDWGSAVPGYVDYGIHHGATLVVDVEQGRFVFFYLPVDLEGRVD